MADRKQGLPGLPPPGYLRGLPGLPAPGYLRGSASLEQINIPSTTMTSAPTRQREGRQLIDFSPRRSREEGAGRTSSVFGRGNRLGLEDVGDALAGIGRGSLSAANAAMFNMLPMAADQLTPPMPLSVAFSEDPNAHAEWRANRRMLGDPIRETLAQFKEEEPTAALTTEVAGAIANPLNRASVLKAMTPSRVLDPAIRSMGTAGKKFADTVSYFTPNWVKGAIGMGKLGATEAALYDIGREEGINMSTLPASTALGGGIGTGVGGAFMGTGAAYRTLTNQLDNPFLERTARALADESTSVSALNREIQRFKRLRETGAPITPSDMFGEGAAHVSPGVRGLFEEVRKSPVGARISANMTRTKRQQESFDSTMDLISPQESYIDASTKLKQSVDNVFEKIGRERKAEFDPKFKQVFEKQPIIGTQAAGRKAGVVVPESYQNLLDTSNIKTMTKAINNNLPKGEKLPLHSTEMAQNVMSKLRGKVSDLQAQKRFNEAKPWESLLKRFEGEVEKYAPDLMKVRNQYAGSMEAGRNFTAGELNILERINSDTPMVMGNKIFRQMDPKQITSLRQKLGNDAEVLDTFTRSYFENAVNSQNVDHLTDSMKLLTSNTSRERLRAALGGGKRADEIMDRVLAEQLIDARKRVFSQKTSQSLEGNIDGLKSVLMRVTSPFTAAGRITRVAVKKFFPKYEQAGDIEAARSIFTTRKGERFLDELAEAYPKYRLRHDRTLAPSTTAGRAVTAVGARGAAGAVGTAQEGIETLVEGAGELLQGAEQQDFGALRRNIEEALQPTSRRGGVSDLNIFEDRRGRLSDLNILENMSGRASDLNIFEDRPDVSEMERNLNIPQGVSRLKGLNVPKKLGGNVDTLLDAIRQVESSGRAHAVGPKTRYGTAKGAYQVLDSTGKEYHAKLGMTEPYNPFNEEQQRIIAQAILEDYTRMFNGDVETAVLAYHTGPGNVRRGNIGPQGRAYVPKVKRALRS